MDKKTQTNTNLLDVTDLQKYYPVHKGVFRSVVGQVKAVDSINLSIKKGESLGLVGESGCGKTTAGRTIMGLIKATGGDVHFQRRKADAAGGPGEAINITKASPDLMKTLRTEMQIIFQDPYSSLNPRMTIDEIIGEGLRVHGVARGRDWVDRVRELLELVGLSPDHMKRFPHQFSGGQRQRIAIARALALRPQLVVADEPVSALDVSIQAQVLNLLQDLQEQLGLTYLFISHDLSVIKYITDRVAVMYLGKIVELTDTDALFSKPGHPYTEALLSAIQVPDPDHRIQQILLDGDVPSPLNPPTGCYFHPRCRYRQDQCRNEQPAYREVEAGHFVTCHLSETLSLQPLYQS
ncbi:MAG: ATP-binding cassette domain-containing protein [Desulfobacteraceae bacterium]|nr:ATP-binding cassette domain-containing protein [Desulfobacteraceae bacterium]